MSHRATLPACPVLKKNTRFLRFLTPRPAALALLAVMLSACSGSSERKTTTYAAGDKASVDKLTYSIVDTQIFPRLGDEAAPRMPLNRFYVIDVAVSNSGNEELPIPGMTLIDDYGKPYEELTDGSGVPKWLGVSPRVQANQTEQGSIIFDAPAGHYKLKLTDETDPEDVYVDIPLSFAHEQLQNETTGTPDTASELDGAAAAPAPKKK
jgi:hypothetical protein